jgi:hypothetical protein
MTDRLTHMTTRQAALVAGWAYLAMFVPGIFANFFVLSGLVVSGDPAATFQNIAGNEALFRGGTVALLVVSVLDIVVALGLYVFFIGAGKSVSLLAAWLRVAYAAIFAVSLTNLALVPGLLSASDYVGESLQAQVMLLLDSFDSGWMVGLLFFGLHLLVISWLALRSGYVPKVLGVLLVVAALGYLVDSLGTFLVPGYGLSIGQYTFLGELVFPVWLVLRGGQKARGE